MAHEKFDGLMKRLPKDIEEVTETGPFFIRNNGGSYSIVVLTEVLVTCGGPDAKETASEFACQFNRVWNKHFAEIRKEVTNAGYKGVVSSGKYG